MSVAVADVPSSSLGVDTNDRCKVSPAPASTYASVNAERLRSHG